MRVDGGSGALLALGRLPQAGVVAGSDQVARGVRLLDRLAEEVARPAGGVSGPVATARWPSSTLTQSRPSRLPYLVLMVDGWESVCAAWESGGARATARTSCTS